MDDVPGGRILHRASLGPGQVRGHATVPALANGSQGHSGFYSTERPHHSLGYRTPEQLQRSTVDVECVSGDVIMFE